MLLPFLLCFTVQAPSSLPPTTLLNPNRCPLLSTILNLGQPRARHRGKGFPT
ncbi:hypothetical protein JMJ76_0010175 [Colletotrichum scovillei]|nr:hypothetical protein JMJ78_0001633 [Colletotrichum scovillei]KAG7061105.1 hypothetical protein JMJ76_0010175 [Colletotrichum scovillei]